LEGRYLADLANHERVADSEIPLGADISLPQALEPYHDHESATSSHYDPPVKESQPFLATLLHMTGRIIDHRHFSGHDRQKKQAATLRHCLLHIQ
jgi:hypothetical protein